MTHTHTLAAKQREGCAFLMCTVLIKWHRPLCGLLGLWLALAVGLWQQNFAARCDAVRQNTLRLHILAADDSVAQQAAKLRVKNRVVQLAGRLYGNAEDIRQAKTQAARCLPRLALAASHELWQQGSRQKVSVGLTNRYFAARTYGEYTLPPGYYDAVQLTIGAGQGQNWWCCLYPQLCLAACSGYADAGQQALVTGDYEIRFRLAEWWQQLTAPPRPAPEQAVCTVGR